jgi:hypothetical protein
MGSASVVPIGVDVSVTREADEENMICNVRRNEQVLFMAKGAAGKNAICLIRNVTTTTLTQAMVSGEL